MYSLEIVKIKYQSILNKKSKEAKENSENLPLKLNINYIMIQGWYMLSLKHPASIIDKRLQAA